MNEVNNGNTFEKQYVYLMENIDLAGETWDVIGSYTDDTTNKAFAGIFEGNNRRINGLNINKNQDFVGLFVYNTGTIRDIILESGSITGNARVGGIVAVNNGIIENCHNKVNININSTNSGGGGIVARNIGEIYFCGNSGNINGEGPYVGGISASSHNKISNCYNEGNIKGKYNVGGITGENAQNSTVDMSFNLGNITSTGMYISSQCSQVGGIAGYSTGRISFCYNTGIIDCYYNNSGGIVGQVSSNYDKNAGIFNCYNIGVIEDKGTIKGNISGGSYAPVKNCYFTREVSDLDGVNYTNENSDIEVYEKTLNYMKTNSFVNDLNKEEEAFTINSNLNNGYPILEWQ